MRNIGALSLIATLEHLETFVPRLLGNKMKDQFLEVTFLGAFFLKPASIISSSETQALNSLEGKKCVPRKLVSNHMEICFFSFQAAGKQGAEAQLRDL